MLYFLHISFCVGQIARGNSANCNIVRECACILRRKLREYPIVWKRLIAGTAPKTWWIVFEFYVFPNRNIVWSRCLSVLIIAMTLAEQCKIYRTHSGMALCIGHKIADR